MQATRLVVIKQVNIRRGQFVEKSSLSISWLSEATADFLAIVSTT
jgi:hypothetical protein